MLRRLDYRWVILTTGFVVLFFSSGSRFAFGLMLKPTTDDLGWSRSTLSLAVTVFMVVSALAMPVIGRLVDRDSLRWIIAGAAFTSAVGIGLMGRVPAPWQAFILYGLGGIFKKCVNSQAVYPLSEQHGLEAQERR